MKLHTSLTAHQVEEALTSAKLAGKVSKDIMFMKFETAGSYSHARGHLINLGTFNRFTGPTKYRRRVNTGNAGANYEVYAATRDEWGWFIARIYQLDPTAKVGPYMGAKHFHITTENAYLAAPVPVEPEPQPENGWQRVPLRHLPYLSEYYVRPHPQEETS